MLAANSVRAGFLGAAAMLMALSPSGTARALEPPAIAALPGWEAAGLGDSLETFRASCRRIMKLAETARLDPNNKAGIFGTAADWKPVCRVALSDEAASDPRGFFARTFTPVVYGLNDGDGLFTGYFEPVYEGSRAPTSEHSRPLLALSPDLLARLKRGETLPARRAIEAGGLDSETQPLVYLDPVDAFFLHVQGSGRIRLDDGTRLRVAFAAKNGQPYVSVGSVLIRNGEIAREDMSMQAIRAWLEANPDRVDEILQANPSYIFFTAGPDSAEGPKGAEGVPLTAWRSIAVDRSVYPLGVPFWLETSVPVDSETSHPFRQLMIAQDTGSAIKGEQRADIFMGTGAEAGETAGLMDAPGRLTVLLPWSLANKVR